ncbi:MAG: hypothetical protein ACLPX5_02030 [Dissulfurispiraceae bacterium]
MHNLPSRTQQFLAAATVDGVRFGICRVDSAQRRRYLRCAAFNVVKGLSKKECWFSNSAIPYGLAAGVLAISCLACI